MEKYGIKMLYIIFVDEKGYESGQYKESFIKDATMEDVYTKAFMYYLPDVLIAITSITNEEGKEFNDYEFLWDNFNPGDIVFISFKPKIPIAAVFDSSDRRLDGKIVETSYNQKVQDVINKFKKDKGHSLRISPTTVSLGDRIHEIIDKDSNFVDIEVRVDEMVFRDDFYYTDNQGKQRSITYFTNETISDLKRKLEQNAKIHGQDKEFEILYGQNEDVAQDDQYVGDLTGPFKVLSF